jgi:hypothetical protein
MVLWSRAALLGCLVGLSVACATPSTHRTPGITAPFAAVATTQLGWVSTTRTCVRFDEVVSRCRETISWPYGTNVGAAVPEIPTVFLQEGGYRIDKIGEAAADGLVVFARNEIIKTNGTNSTKV